MYSYDIIINILDLNELLCCGSIIWWVYIYK